MKLVRNKVFVIVVIFFLQLLAACVPNGKQAEVQGEIALIIAKVPFGDIGPDFERLALTGTIWVELPDDVVGSVNCPVELLSEIKIPQNFEYLVDQLNIDPLHGTLIADILIKLEENQRVLLVKNNTEEWEVVKFLD